MGVTEVCTYDEWWPKVKHLYKSVMEELGKLVYEALESNRPIDREIYETLYEEVEVVSDSDYTSLLHDDIPYLLKKIFGELGFSVRIWHRKDDIDNYEYFAEVFTSDNRCVFVGLCIDIDLGYYNEDKEGEVAYGSVELLVAEAIPYSFFPHSLLVYYHEV